MKSVELVEAALGKIQEVDRTGYRLNSILALDESALDLAQKYDKEGDDLPLQGIPILIKDNIEAVGLPATAGSLALSDTAVIRDSTIAERLRAAGAILIGSTNLSEWANIRSTSSTSGWSAVGGLTANPWKHEYSAGGSSSGSGAAVAAGLTQWAIGSETDGSIICPASLNGCVGIKPTVGSIPTDGMVPISRSQDSPGPMSQTVLQAAQLLDVLTAKNENVRAASDQRSLKIGVVKQWRSSLPEVNAVFEETVAKLSKSGMHIAEVNLNSPTEKDGEDELTVLLSELDYEMQKYLSTRTGTRVKSLDDIISFNNEFSDQEMQYFGQEHFEKAIQISSDRNRYESARERNQKWANNSLQQGLADADVLIGCTYGPAWISSLGHGDKVDGGSWITMLAAIAGSPIGTLPMGLVSGLPVGLGLVVGKNQESKLISAMAQVERLISSNDLKPTFIK